jgi:hypothetical protein
MFAPEIVPLVEVREFHVEHSALYAFEPKIVADDFVPVFCAEP